MSNHPSSFSEWQNYPSTLDPIHVAWLKNAKKSKTAFAVADIEGIKRNKTLKIYIGPKKIVIQ